MYTILSNFLLNHFINWALWAMHKPEKPESALYHNPSVFNTQRNQQKSRLTKYSHFVEEHCSWCWAWKRKKWSTDETVGNTQSRIKR